MYCRNCGNKLKEEENFCRKCGTPRNQKEPSKEVSQTNSKNISLVTGIIACFFCWFPIIAIPLAIISIIVGKQYKKETDTKTVGPLLGIISLILSILIIVLSVLGILFFINLIEDYEDSGKQAEKIYDYSDEPKESFDIKGYSWTGDDGSLLYLNKDNTYTWYQDDKVHNNNYYNGTYQFYTGKDAITYIATNLAEYGITKEEQEDLIEKGGYDLEEYYLIILTCSKAVVDGTETSPENHNHIVYYYGFYKKSIQYLDLVNINTANPAGFTLNERISNIDL